LTCCMILRNVYGFSPRIYKPTHKNSSGIVEAAKHLKEVRHKTQMRLLSFPQPSQPPFAAAPTVRKTHVVVVVRSRCA
jgi:hypothetical protein